MKKKIDEIMVNEDQPYDEWLNEIEEIRIKEMVIWSRACGLPSTPAPKPIKSMMRGER